MTPEERSYAEALATAIAEDVRDHPPEGPLVRVVIRWFESEKPLYLTVHALGADDRETVAGYGDAWYPLEWPNADPEEERTDRIAAQATVRRTGEALSVVYESAVDAGDMESWAPSPAIVETVRRLHGSLRSAGVVLADDFAASAAHFEGWGALAVLQQTADLGQLATLKGRGELPDE